MSNIVQIALFTVVKGRLPGSEQPTERMILIRCVFLWRRLGFSGASGLP